MKNFFLSNPVLSIVMSIVIVLFGLACLPFLPVEKLPNLSPTQVVVSALLPGGDSKVTADSLATPLEKALSGTPNLLYTSSTSDNTGSTTITAVFETGTDLKEAHNDVQNRVNGATPNLPEEVQKSGVSVSDSNSGILMIISIQGKGELYTQRYLSNYTSTHILPKLERIPGVGNAQIMNGSEYSMRIWLKPDRMAQFNVSPAQVKTAILEQNAQYALGEIGQQPAPPETKLTIPVFTSGLLKTVEDFENIILRAESDGSAVYLRDISRIELGSENYEAIGKLNGELGAFILIEKTPLGNALVVGKEVKEKMVKIASSFPSGMNYSIPYDTTRYIQASIHEVIQTFIIALLLVSLIILLFLHRIEIALVPIIAMLVSITGTFIGMYLLDYSINTLTLFGLILAIGIVVDDAIIVVEKIESNIRIHGMKVEEAAEEAMGDLTAPIVAIFFSLLAVFIPVMFMSGIAGQLYKQFAVTIVISVFISGFVALTLSPVLSVMLFKKEPKNHSFATRFNHFFDRLTDSYMMGVSRFLNMRGIGIGLWLLILVGIGVFSLTLPRGLIPTEDQGALIISATLPNGASLNRTEAVMQQIETIVSNQPGIKNYLAFSGYGSSNQCFVYLELLEWNKRKKPQLQANAILQNLNHQFTNILEATVIGFNIPPIPQADQSDAYEFWVVNEGAASDAVIRSIVNQFVEEGAKRKELSYIRAAHVGDSLGLYLKLNRIYAKAMGVNLNDLFYTLQVLFGSAYVNDFNDLGQMVKVIVQAETSWRSSLNLIKNIFVPSANDQMIPLGALISTEFSTRPTTISHYNGNPATLLSIGCRAAPNEVIAAVDEIAMETLPSGVSYSWTGAAYLANTTAHTILYALAGGLVMIFLSLAALYGRWLLPIVVLLAIPFSIFGAMAAVWLRGMEMDLYFQVGLIASIGISAKNSILIVEFARVKRKEGLSLAEAVKAGARGRFRPILLTSLCIILAVLPLCFGGGAGAASKHSVGTGILGGMCAATLLALFWVPLFFSLIEKEEDQPQ